MLKRWNTLKDSTWLIPESRSFYKYSDCKKPRIRRQTERWPGRDNVARRQRQIRNEEVHLRFEVLAGGEDVHGGLLGCDVELTCRYALTFCKNILPSSSGDGTHLQDYATSQPRRPPSIDVFTAVRTSNLTSHLEASLRVSKEVSATFLATARALYCRTGKHSSTVNVMLQLGTTVQLHTCISLYQLSHSNLYRFLSVSPDARRHNRPLPNACLFRPHDHALHSKLNNIRS
jgi:hypothetical protein